MKCPLVPINRLEISAEITILISGFKVYIFTKGDGVTLNLEIYIRRNIAKMWAILQSDEMDLKPYPFLTDVEGF